MRVSYGVLENQSKIPSVVDSGVLQHDALFLRLPLLEKREL